MRSDREDRYVLPSHLEFCETQSSNPWRNLFLQDFILVAEFSEQEGPRPLFTIPEDAGEIFDKNAFAVHVMAVDYQTQSNASSIVVDDTQLIFSEDRENIHAYVHHFILYDIEARGFVRPYCMCYISNCKKKILTNFEHFIQEFSKISTQFKQSNKSVFHRDLKQRLADLNYVKDLLKDRNGQTQLAEHEQSTRPVNLHGLNNDAIDSMYQDTEKAINNLKTRHEASTAESQLIEDDINYESSICENLCENSDQQEIIQRLLRERRRHLLVHRNIDELCGFHAMEGLASLQRLHQNFHQPFEVFSTMKEESPLIDPISSIFTVGGSFVMNFGSNIDLSSTVAIPSSKTDNIGPVTSSYHSTNSVLSGDSYESCVDEKEIDDLAENDVEHFTYTPFRKLTWKDLLRHQTKASVDETSCTTSSDIASKLGSLEDLGDPNAPSSSFESPPSPLIHASHFVSREPGGLGSTTQRHSTGDLTSLLSNSTPAVAPPALRRQFSAVETKSSSYLNAISENISIPDPTRSDLLRSDMPRSLHQLGNYYPVGSTPKYSVLYEDCFTTDKICSEEVTKLHSPEHLSLQSYAQQLPSRKANGPGGRILRVMRDYSYLVHLLYALLRGRTVVVLGEPRHQKDIQSLITALWLFVPGNFRCFQEIVLWRTQPLKLADLGRFKLVGLCKSKQCNVLPVSIEAHVTTLDFETECLKTPPYQGEYLNQMLASRRCWKTDAIFLAYVHSIFLEMAMKAYICYYATRITTTNLENTNSERNVRLLPRKFSMEYMSDVLDSLGILGSDANIVMYFVDLITQQQQRVSEQTANTSHMSVESASLDSNSSLSTTETFGLYGVTTKSNPIQLDFSQRMLFRNSKQRNLID